MTTTIGRIIDHYQLEERIGVGGMATVYRARDVRLDRQVAIKIMHPHFAEDETFRTRFKREAKSAANLDHPAIIQIYQYGEIDQLLYMAMEYVHTGSLATYIRQLQADDKVLPLQEILVVMAQVADALDYAHRRGIVHRDVKPDNILVKELDRPDRPGDVALRAVVMDFGLAKLLSGDKVTRTGTFMGTLAYMAPEQALAEKVDGRSDIYSVGVILYQLATGQLPLDIESPTDAVLKHLREVPTPPRAVHAGIPPAVAQVIEKALAKKREERFDSAEILARELRAVAATITPEQAVEFAPPENTISLVTTVKSQPPLPPEAIGTVVEPAPERVPFDYAKNKPEESGVAHDPSVQQAGGTVVEPPSGTVIQPSGTVVEPPSGTVIQPTGTVVESPDEATQTINIPALRQAQDEAVSSVAHDPSVQQSAVSSQQSAVSSQQSATSDQQPITSDQSPPDDKAWAKTQHIFGGTVVEPTSPSGEKPPFPQTIIEQPSANWTEVTPRGDFTQIPEQVRQDTPLPSYQVGGGMPLQPLGSGVGITLNPASIRANAGDVVNVQASLFNQSPNVEHFTIDVQGNPVGAWANVAQTTVQLMPSQQAMLPIAIHIPQDSRARAGNHAFKVVATAASTQLEAGSAAGTLTILPFEQFTVAMQPSTVRHGRSGKLNVTNSGNTDTRFKITGRDPAGMVKFDISQPSIDIAAGNTATIPIKVRGGERTTFGRTESYPFEVRVTSGAGTRQAQRGELVVPPRLSGGCFGIAILAVLFACLSAMTAVTASSTLLPNSMARPIRGLIPGAVATPIANLLGDFAAVDVVTPELQPPLPPTEVGANDDPTETPPPPPTQDDTVTATEHFLTVAGQANIFLAGREEAPADIFDPGILPAQIAVPADHVITFPSVTGQVTASEVLDVAGNGADGGTLLGSTDVDSYFGISGLMHDSRGVFLVGVFLDDRTPTPPEPNRLDMSEQGSGTIFAPEIGQTFMVGDGLNDNGDTQRFIAPSGATRLFLGFADAFYLGRPGLYGDNKGEMTVTVSISAETATDDERDFALQTSNLFTLPSTRFNIGQSVNGAPIKAVQVGNGDNTILLIGGIHGGFATGTVALGKELIDHFVNTPDDVPNDTKLIIVPNMNPDSVFKIGSVEGRNNVNGVDPNDNFDCKWEANGKSGSAPFSEPETQAIRDFVIQEQPSTVVLYTHVPEFTGAIGPGECGVDPQPATAELANAYGNATGYGVVRFSHELGDAADWLDGQGIPAIFVLLPEQSASDFDTNLNGIKAILNP